MMVFESYPAKLFAIVANSLSGYQYIVLRKTIQYLSAWRPAGGFFYL
jgi:hypothetical protein